MRVLFIFAIALQTSLAFANHDARMVKRQSDAVNDLVQQRADSLTQDQLNQIYEKLQVIRRIVDGNPPPPPPPPPPGGGAKYSATCHIDDDPDFDYDQNVVGSVRGDTISSLISECQFLAQSTYGDRGSSGIKDIELNTQARGVIYKAVCHIDDDPDFDYDQNVVGLVGGRTAVELKDDCAAIAQMTYGDRGSSGIKDLTVVDNLPPRYNVAECHLDDDTDFDYDQFVVGQMAGETVAELVEQCAALAQDRYGARGTSGLKNWNVDREPSPFVSSAECHIDDDPDFDYDLVVVGRLFGNGVSEIAAGCELIAESVYGSRGSSGLKNIQ